MLRKNCKGQEIVCCGMVNKNSCHHKIFSKIFVLGADKRLLMVL